MNLADNWAAEADSAARAVRDGTPMGDLKASLAMVDAMQAATRRTNGWAYHSYEGLVLALGQEHPWRPRPSWVTKQRDKECFRNAHTLAIQRDLTYVEGFAAGIIPILHAWCLDADGYVIDPTWHEDADDDHHLYIGIPMDVWAVAEHCASLGYYGVLANDWMNDCKALRDGTLP